MHDKAVTEIIIKAAIEVHRQLGPGLLEGIYEECLYYEIQQCGVTVERQKMLPIVYKGRSLEGFYRLDLFVDGKVVVELKSVEKILPVHEAQLLSYLRLTGLKTGLLLNFHTALLKDGIRRMVL